LRQIAEGSIKAAEFADFRQRDCSDAKGFDATLWSHLRQKCAR
jgi:hypothetical protein